MSSETPIKPAGQWVAHPEESSEELPRRWIFKAPDGAVLAQCEGDPSVLWQTIYCATVARTDRQVGRAILASLRGLLRHEQAARMRAIFADAVREDLVRQAVEMHMQENPNA